MGAFPSVRLVLDTREQRVHRPGGGFAAQKPCSSMKKKAHTVKTKLGLSPDGLFESVDASVPGGAKHDKTLLRESDPLERLGPARG